jgi:2'-5' RNA ligase
VPINGIFILCELDGEAGKAIREVQLEFDPKLAATRGLPHVTIAGSSGLGPVSRDTTIAQLREALEPIAQKTSPMSLPLEQPMQFMQTNIVILPLDPYGPIRELHDRIARSGLNFGPSRFTFTPHATLSLYPTLSREQLRKILKVRVTAPAVLKALTVYHTMDPQPSRRLLDIPFGEG